MNHEGIKMSYTTIKIPTDFVRKYIDSLLEQDGLGFSSRTEVVKTAIREYSQKADKKVGVKN